MSPGFSTSGLGRLQDLVTSQGAEVHVTVALACDRLVWHFPADNAFGVHGL
jgi:hypothetical protein